MLASLAAAPYLIIVLLAQIPLPVKKDSYFLYQSNWSENPMVHITGKRLTERRKRTEIKIYSNCEAVTLYVNDVKIKTIEASCVWWC